MKKIFAVFVDKCVSAGRYGEWNCMFNAKLIFSLLGLLNIATLLLYLVGRDSLLKFWEQLEGFGVYILVVVSLALFLLLGVIYPLREITDVKLMKEEKRRIIVRIYLYVAISLFLFLGALYFR